MNRRGFLLSSLAALPALAGCGASAPDGSLQPQGQFVTIGGARLHALVRGRGRGRGRDVVLIHGASGNIRDFTLSLMPLLAQSYRVIAIDRPGFGFSDHLTPAHAAATGGAYASPSQQARALRGVAERFGARRPLVLGHSYGGAVALAWALDAPQSLSGLALVSAVTQPFSDGLSASYALAASDFGGAALVPIATGLASETRIRNALRSIFAPQPIPPGYVENAGVQLALRPATFRANARQINGLAGDLSRLQPRYGQLRLPVEAVHGTADGIVGFDRHARPLPEQVPGARLTPLGGIGHMPHHVAPGAVVGAVDRLARRAR